ncbi:helix-turn-helix transcriptional regulator [Streptomyces mobaraensis NBRC 13819 = DSM 40847]|uniref:XRE family transcriptional regulator n=1 Tax=Streptomyces mobaraensis (strain ATCC 29032 / DSM 40847 / JCM 4168 / NBRC 13819 / NCIMB 11159 / IPCR 16-22) TaxID=1223523 RepID=M3BZL1_STRM1|nr:helix-turn-helix transcriptional regulator [Streptomyces mobaraensis]EME97200.1 XRE family transcriptional regulator [Streptomyces mobaraensis NBRC 13819 = DSM 40847]QTT73846.1 helix-turn-helix transcriptional regulator [Streptomyces mobaraensis NBRC 13819 = DSM 40847]
MRERSWREVRAEAVELHPWLESDEAVAQRAEERAASTARIRGHELAGLRRTAGFTQAEVAAVLGVSQARVSQIEHGQVDSLDTLRAYAAVLGGEVSVIVQRGDVSVKVA